MYHNAVTIPTEGLEISRKMMSESSEMLRDETRAAILSLTDVPRDDITSLRVGVALVDLIEFAEKRLDHPVLSTYRPNELIDPILLLIRNEKSHLSHSIKGINLGAAQIDETREGAVSIGFTIHPESEELFIEERKEVIDILLDMAGIHPDDDIRKWQYEEGNFWVPVFEVATGVTPIDELLGELTDDLDERFYGEPVDFFDVKARSEKFDIPRAIVEEHIR